MTSGEEFSFSKSEEEHILQVVRRSSTWSNLDEHWPDLLSHIVQEPINDRFTYWKHDLPRISSILNNPVSFTDTPLQRREIADTGKTVSNDWGVLVQRRSGARHGQGGRKRAASGVVQRLQVSDEVCRLLCRALSSLIGSDILQCVELIIKTVLNKKTLPNSINLQKEDQPWNQMQSNMSLKPYELIDSPLFSACHMVHYSGLQRGQGNAMERHFVCFWIGIRGHLYCTCVGSTRFRSVHLNTLEESEITTCRCIHTQGMLQFIESIASEADVKPIDVSLTVSTIFEQFSKSSINSYRVLLPMASAYHKGSVIIVTSISAGEDMFLFVPVRVLRRRSGLACCFCDATHFQHCFHVRQCHHLESSKREMGGKIEKTTREEGADCYSNAFDVDSTSCISHLALSPVNCKRSIRVDLEVARAAVRRETFKLNAPHTCHCGYTVLHSTRVVHQGGVIMCTVGPCLMEVEEFRCSNPDDSHRVIQEGRSSCVLLLNVSTAATHVLLRRELIGVIMGNGTLSGRLKHFHSMSVENARSGILSPDVNPRSFRTMVKLTTEMLRLMTLSPSASLFQCGICDIDDGHDKRVDVICVDGIYQGYLKRKQVASTNFSEICTTFPVSKSQSGLTFRRPNTRFIRKISSHAFLIKAIRGKEISCKTRFDAEAIVSAVRLASASTLDEYYFLGSVCGTTEYDYFEDIGSESTLNGINSLVSSLFNTSVLLDRLLRPLYSYISDSLRHSSHTSELRKTGAMGRKFKAPTGHFPLHSNYRRGVPSLLNQISGLLLVGRNGSELCWKPEIQLFFSSQCDGGTLGQELMSIFTAFIQGPVCQFILERDVTALRRLSDVCRVHERVEIHEIVHDTIDVRGNLTSAKDFIRRNRLIRAGLITILQLEEYNQAIGFQVRQSFGTIFSLAARLVEKYYRFYDFTRANHPAIQYARKWDSSSRPELIRQFNEAFNPTRPSTYSMFELACQTGSYFPALPQVRPLPFNVDEVGNAEQPDFGVCSKEYLQRQSSYTPGAIVISCSCPKSISFGFKVLCNDEGPKAILDTIITRFPEIPRYVIYDFACGLYSSAAHSLWWALRDTVIVTDGFHLKNHSQCSPAYNPRLHSELDLANTVAHEQNNRAIKGIGKSLRNCSQRTYVGLLSYLLIIENIRAKTRRAEQYFTAQNFDDFDLHWCYYVCLAERCTCCDTVTST